MASTLRVAERDRHAVPFGESFFGRGVYGREGRRLGIVRVARAGRPGGNQPYAVVELGSFSRNASDLRAIPLSALCYRPERGLVVCDLSELSVRSAPRYTGSADWLDSRWTSRLDDYFDAISC